LCKSKTGLEFALGEDFMKIGLAFFLVFSLSTFAAEKYGVYDSQGQRVSTFEAEWFDLSEKAKQIKQENSHKNLYVSSLKKGKSSKPNSRYSFNAETGAYIEAFRKETFAICPEKEVEGTWISEYSVYLNAKNCLSVQAPNLAGTFRILFLQNNGLTDTIQVLVEQSYIQMEDYSHRIWVTDLKYTRPLPNGGDDEFLVGPCREDLEDCGGYENRNYSQPLIVDKTKFTMRDALYYSKIGNRTLSRFTLEREEYKNEKLEESSLPLIDVSIADVWHFANERSKKEGLDTAYIIIKPNSEETGKLILLENPLYNTCKSCTILALDTSASGYRSQFNEEWFFLMHAGTSTRYYWGNEEDSHTVSRYEWVKPIGLKPVAQKLPNGFGLYDMAGIADDFGATCRSNLSPECIFIDEIRAQEKYVKPSNTTCEIKAGETEWQNISDGKCTTTNPEISTRKVYYQSLRLLRKTPKLHKLEKF